MIDESETDTASTMIRNAKVLSMDPDIGDLDRGDVLVVGDKIEAVGTDLEAPPAARVVDASGCIVIPGFVDTHRHMFQAIVRGCAPQHTLDDYYSVVLGSIAPALTTHDLYLGNLLSARAALQSGVTTVQDISNIQDSPEHTNALVRALGDAGIRAVFAYGKSFGAIQATGCSLPDDVRRVRGELLADDGALVTMALVAEAFDPEGIRHNAALARELDLRTAGHVSSDFPVSRLRDCGVLLPGSTFIHGNGLGPEELQLIIDSGSSLSVAPAIEMMMGHGYPMLPDAPPALALSLSTDVEVTCPADMFTQMRAAFQSSRSKQLSDAASTREITVHDVLDYVTRGGAAALGLDDRTGTLTPGKQADLVVLRADRPDVAPVVDPYSTVVLQMDRAHVDTVLVAGHTKIAHGAPTAGSDAVVEEAEATVERLARQGLLTMPSYGATRRPSDKAEPRPARSVGRPRRDGQRSRTSARRVPAGHEWARALLPCEVSVSVCDGRGTTRPAGTGPKDPPCHAHRTPFR